MKQILQIMSLPILLALQTNAQVIVGTGSSLNSEAVTSYFSVCPTAGAATVTLSTTTTICPGPSCGGTTTLFYDPKPMTTVGPDGKTTVFEHLQYTAPCPCDGGVCDAVYTITRECPCTALPEPTFIPSGFTTSEMACHLCAENGGPRTVTVITPVPSGPYATQTPSMGSPYNGASASAGANAYARVGPEGAVASASANAVATADNGNAGVIANASVGVTVGNKYIPSASDTVAESQTTSTGTNPPVASYTGTADKVSYRIPAVIACLMGWAAIVL